MNESYDYFRSLTIMRNPKKVMPQLDGSFSEWRRRMWWYRFKEGKMDYSTL
jgi:hypothetical protein